MKKEEILKFYLNYRLYIFPGIVTLSSLILIVFVIFPQTSKLLSNQSAKQEILNKSKFLEAKAETLESYDERDLNIKVNYAITSYPTEKDFANVVGVLQNLTAQTGFSISSLNLGSSSNSKVGQSYSIRLDAVGPLSLLPILLNKIESSPRLMRISSVETISARDPNSVTVDLGIDVLYSAPPSEFGSVDSPLPELSKQDENILAQLASTNTQIPTSQLEQAPSQLGPRGKANPFQ